VYESVYYCPSSFYVCVCFVRWFACLQAATHFCVSGLISLTSTTTYSVTMTGLKYVVVKNGSTASFAPNGYYSTGTDYATVKNIFKTESAKYFGITGQTLLNTAGDRSSGVFDYWGISLEAGKYKWVFRGKSS
jgi:hypothetical protein